MSENRDVESPLNWTPDRFLDLERKQIICATHGAVFCIDDGLCVGGPCKGSRSHAKYATVRSTSWVAGRKAERTPSSDSDPFDSDREIFFSPGKRREAVFPLVVARRRKGVFAQWTRLFPEARD